MSLPRDCARLVLGLLLLVVVAAPTAADGFTGRVVGVQDGDTITVLHGNRRVVVRLEGIDCPEDGQPFTEQAERFVSTLVLGETVVVDVKEMDHYGRTVGRVRVEDTDTSLALVEAGLAWHFKKYSNDPVLARAEVEARAERRGLWSDPNPTPPWEYRHPTIDGPVTGPYHGNVRSHVFHRPGCRWYDCKNCTQEFATREEAIQAGYRPGGCCRP